MNKALIALAVTVALFIGGAVGLQLQTPQEQTVAGDINVLGRIATSSAITVTTSSSQLIATSTARNYLAIVNTGSNYVCLALNNDKPATDCQGIYLAANGGSYEILGENLYRGAIRAISNTGNSVVTVFETTGN